MSTDTYAVGARIILRDEEWRITQIAQADLTNTRMGKKVPRVLRIKCIGLSELVRGKVGIFYDVYEKNGDKSGIEVLRPETTHIVEDHSANYIESRLYLEALLRAAPKNDPKKIEVANKAAMDPLPYQFDPALRALGQTRARILIADAVGIGKTLEAGILTSELIARGRGRRILVLATKAMLTQFQQEFWTRFTIPLTRLDSAGIQRVRNRIPVNHNPFLYFDRAIISIDTLKQDHEYREYLKKAYWDIIILDEAHNVAVRNNHSQRAALAQLLSTRSDTMILLSATPHDGRAESFASLLRLLDPTAIADPSNYGVEDFADKGLVIRRFKSNVKTQVKQRFPDREIDTVEVKASEEEQAVFKELGELSFKTLDAPGHAYSRLFSTTLLKAFLSSPAACISVIDNRIGTLQNRKKKSSKDVDIKNIDADIETLKSFKTKVEAVTPEKFNKLQCLAKMLKSKTTGSKPFDWDRQDPEDRLVVFTESVKTLDFLKAHLPKLAGLSDAEVLAISGADNDADIAAKVNQFNNREAKVRLFLCSDIASEGINLHHFAHRMIHFDIPWALMTFQQRNGRIDRYGQTKQPQIWYMQTVDNREEGTDEAGVPQKQNDATEAADTAPVMHERSDTRVLKRLIEKDKQVQENLSDPAEFLLSVEAQEGRTAAEVEGHLETAVAVDNVPTTSLAAFAKLAAKAKEQVIEEKVPAQLAPVLKQEELNEAIAHQRKLFASDMDYAKEMLGWLSRTNALSGASFEYQDDSIILGVPLDLEARLKYLPAEILPKEARFNLTDDVKKVERELRQCRLSGNEWPKLTLLWPLHPVMLWLQDRALGLFGRNTAPLVRIPSLKPGERWFLLDGGYPNRRGFMPLHKWIVVHEVDGTRELSDMDTLIQTLGLTTELANLKAVTSSQLEGEEPDLSPFFKDSVVAAVALAQKQLEEAAVTFKANSKAALEKREAELEILEQRHLKALTPSNAQASKPDQTKDQAKDAGANNAAKVEEQHSQNRKRGEIKRFFVDARRYLEDTTGIEDEPWIQLDAVFASMDDGVATNVSAPADHESL